MKRTPVFVFGVLLLFLALVLPALAQTHPCDQPPPPQSSISSGAPYRVQFCQPQADQVQAVIAFVDGVAHDLLPVTAKTGPSSTGKVLYETGQFFQVAKGTHSMILASYNRDASGALQLGAATAPFTFAAVDAVPLPSVPAIIGILK